MGEAVLTSKWLIIYRSLNALVRVIDSNIVFVLKTGLALKDEL